MTEAVADSKARLLDAAMHVIRAKGYTAASVDDICTAAGLTKGSFFHHFDSKEDLAVEAAGHFAKMAGGLFTSAPFARKVDPLDRLLGYVDFRAGMLGGDLTDYSCLLGTMVQETYGTHPSIRKACERHLLDHVAMLTRDIADAKRLHAPRARWSPEGLAFHIQAVVQGAIVLAKASDGPEVAIECLMHLRRYLALLFKPAKEK
ncbi:MAG TPA: helix-turn-helix domain-containing protein [Casimicrobiaceae bacterium]|nr:helix-turn-helix domain-containing protein [Casimicrobiaceae bacterium]